MIRQKEIFFLCVLVLFSACKDRDSAREELTISGTLANAEDSVFLLQELTPSEVIPVDSIFTDSRGHFSYSMQISSAGFYRIVNQDGVFITLALEPHEQVELKADAQDLRATYEVNGSEGSKILWHINRYTLAGIQKADSLRKEYREHLYHPDFLQIRERLSREYKALQEDQRLFVLQVVEENMNSLASILALYHYFENQLLIDQSEYFEYFKRLSQVLCSHYPTNKHVINLKKQVREYKRVKQENQKTEKTLSAGRPAPEISLPDPQGNIVSLSSLRGNVVLIDFWASWCPPCREANHLLGDLYQKYHDQGFEIFGVSLDRTREQWVNAISKDNISWIQVSDLRFMNSPAVSLYHISEIPHYVLVDAHGKIIARNFSINQLEALLQESL